MHRRRFWIGAFLFVVLYSSDFPNSDIRHKVLIRMTSYPNFVVHISEDQVTVIFRLRSIEVEQVARDDRPRRTYVTFPIGLPTLAPALSPPCEFVAITRFDI